MKHASLLLFTVFFLGSCKEKYEKYYYPQDISISYSNGNPKKLGSIYFPYKGILEFDLGDSTRRPNRIDTFFVNNHSKYLFYMNEPILSNYYLHKQIIRLCWDRSFEPSVILRFENRKEGIYLIEKESYLIYDSLQTKQGKTIMYFPSKYNRKTWERKIPDFSWSIFTNMLEESGFYNVSLRPRASCVVDRFWPTCGQKIL